MIRKKSSHYKIRQINVGTIQPLKYEVFDLNRSTNFTLSSGTWDLYSSTSGSVVLSGSLVINNADEDRAGNTVKTVTGTIDLTTTDGSGISSGAYYALFSVTLSSGQTAKFRIPIEMTDLAAVGGD